jgi:hypothetical protein
MNYNVCLNYKYYLKIRIKLYKVYLKIILKLYKVYLKII